jgi:hypothetical protein
MDWFAPVDLYCERLSVGFWAEPWNALSNGAFIVAALLCGIEAARRRDRTALTLSYLVAVVGVGSFLFHTFANRLTYLGDVVPIGIFIVSYLAVALRRFLNLPSTGAFIGVLVFAVATFGLIRTLPPTFLNGSAPYVSAWLVLLGISSTLILSGHAAGQGLLAAFGTFTAGFACRVLDPAVCGAFPLGTHFLWHILDAATLYILVRTAMQPSAAKLPALEMGGVSG